MPRHRVSPSSGLQAPRGDLCESITPGFTRRIHRILKRHFEDIPGEHLRRKAADIEQEMRYVSARLTGELTKFEGAEIIPGGR
jgi:hypothetical protein